VTLQKLCSARVSDRVGKKLGASRFVDLSEIGLVLESSSSAQPEPYSVLISRIDCSRALHSTATTEYGFSSKRDQDKWMLDAVEYVYVSGYDGEREEH
jgi:hypothetical protein